MRPQRRRGTNPIRSEEPGGDERVRAVRLADGRMIDADLVVLAIGVRPNIDLARAAGLDVNRGIVVDDAMLTSDAAIHAARVPNQWRAVAKMPATASVPNTACITRSAV